VTAISLLQRDNRNVKIESLHEAPHHHRVRWGSMTKLRDSILENGLWISLLVRERPRSQGGGYEIIDGVRRKRAATDAGLKMVPVTIVDVDDLTAIQMQLEANLEREDVHPMDEALYFKDLVDRGMDPTAIAKRYDRKRAEVDRRLSLLALSDASRAAYVSLKNPLDLPAALALATVEPPRQKDILAALANGALSVEDVPGYVQREMQAPLDGVPWLLSDATLDVKAGACANCPKRTSVQRALFEQVAADRCRDVTCYRGKMNATYTLESAKPGVTVYDGDAPNVFVPTAGGRPNVMKSSGMIDAESNCPHVSGLTWREAVEASQNPENPPTLYVMRDQEGRPRWLFRESIVVRLVRKSDAAAAQTKDRENADPVRPEVSPRAETKIRRAVIDQLAENVVAADFDIWGWIVAQVIDSAAARSISEAARQFEDVIKEEFPQHETKAKEALLAIVGAKSNRVAKGIAAAVLIRELADVTGDLHPALLALAKVCEIDVAAIERGIRKVPEVA
jgi:ParB/RepB/Spo0J family partition protein